MGLHLLIFSKLQFTAWPEMVSFPYFINHGFVTYRDMVHVYPPLLVNILAILYKVFGYDVMVLKSFGWVGILVSDALIYLILSRLTKRKDLAILGVLSYVILQPVLEGNMVWPDLAIVPFLLLSTLFLIDKKYVFAGLAIALGVLTKQTGVLYMVCGAVYIMFFGRNVRNFLKFWMGSLIIFIPFAVSLVVQKSLVEFVNWTVTYPATFWTKFPGYVQMDMAKRDMLIMVILIVPVIVMVLRNFKKNVKDKQLYLFLGFGVCGLIAVYPRFSFFHFQSAMAFIIILNFYLARNLLNKHGLILLLIPVFITLLSFKNLQFGGDRFWSDTDLVLAKEIEERSPDAKPIYLLNLPSNFYVFANRLPSKPWIDNFGWYLEIPGVQEKVIEGFEENPPEVVFWQTAQKGNWYDIGTYVPKKITEWIGKNYSKGEEIEKEIWEWKRKI